MEEIFLFEPLNIILRVFSALIFLFAATKFLTKRSLSSLTYFDYIAATTLGTIAGNLAFNVKIHILNFILSIILVTLIISLVSYLSLKYKSFRKFFAGEPTILIKDGKILEDNLISLNYSYDYLNQQLRQEKVFDICQVEVAMLEPSGRLSVQLKPQDCPLTSSSLHLSTKQENFPIELILEGKLIEKNLRKNRLTQQWLYKELRKREIENIKEVAFAALASNGNFYVNLYND